MDSKKKYIEEIIDVKLDDEMYSELQYSWKAFCENPGEYKDSVVIDMVLLWHNDKKREREASKLGSLKALASDI